MKDPDHERLIAAQDTHELARALLALPPLKLGEDDRGERWANVLNDNDGDGIIDVCLRHV